ncbi:MAG: outer membrane beta-barrel domain-containing protein [Oleiphilus sp.]
METRSQRIFLNRVVTLLTAIVCLNSAGSLAQDRPLIEPDVEPVVITEALIDTENFEIGVTAGVISIEDFESSFVYGARLAYHLSEDIFFEANIGYADAGETSAEQLGQVSLLTDDEREYTYYNINVAYNMLPGQAYFASRYTFNTNFYLIMGLGATEFADDNRFTINYGAGYQVLFTDELAWTISARQHIYKIDLLGEEKNSINTQFSTGFSVFF